MISQTRAFTLAFCLVLAATHSAAAVVKASKKAPGGLKVQDTPLFILFSHDDAVNARAYDLVVNKVTKNHKNKNGCRVPATWFGCTKDCDFSCSVARDVHAAGHEMAAHTMNHPDLRPLAYNQIKKEIVGSRDAIVRCGIPKAEVTGFRTPFLSDSPEVRRVLYDNGFRYDSTIGVNGGRNKLWPATLEAGVPYDCDAGGNFCRTWEKHPGMFAVPLYSNGGNSMDYCSDEATGAPRPGCSVYGVLKQAIDDAYNSNRGPVTIGIHSVTTGWLARNAFRKDLNDVLKYALAKKDVWMVTHAQFLDWMEAPVPAKNMTSFMAKYKCVR